MRWVSPKNDGTFLVNQEYVRNALYSIVFIIIRFGLVIVDWLEPVFLLNVNFGELSGFILAYTDDLDLVSPFLTMLSKHLFIMGHWWLTWRTPGCPKINQPHFSFYVIQINRISCILKCRQCCDRLELFSWTYSSRS